MTLARLEPDFIFCTVAQVSPERLRYFAGTFLPLKALPGRRPRLSPPNRAIASNCFCPHDASTRLRSSMSDGTFIRDRLGFAIARSAAKRRSELGINGRSSGTARPFPLWRLRSGPCATPINPKYSRVVFRSCPPRGATTAATDEIGLFAARIEFPLLANAKVTHPQLDDCRPTFSCGGLSWPCGPCGRPAPCRSRTRRACGPA
jgi:hypothetical protein